MPKLQDKNFLNVEIIEENSRPWTTVKKSKTCTSDKQHRYISYSTSSK